MHCSFYFLVLGRVYTKWSDASSLWLAADQQNSVIQSREIMQAYIKHATAIARFHSQLGQKWKLAPSLGQHDIMTSISNCIPPLHFQFSSFLFSFSFLFLFPLVDLTKKEQFCNLFLWLPYPLQILSFCEITLVATLIILRSFSFPWPLP